VDDLPGNASSRTGLQLGSMEPLNLAMTLALFKTSEGTLYRPAVPPLKAVLFQLRAPFLTAKVVLIGAIAAERSNGAYVTP
jgi:hypothetical protein